MLDQTDATGSAAWELRGLFGHPVEPDFVAVDVETACSNMSSICQIGIVGFHAGRELFAFESLIDPRETFSPFNIRVHGIEPDHVINQPTFADIFDRVAGLLADRFVVAHSGFDRTALAAVCRAQGLPTIRCQWLDSVSVARHAWPDLESHRLSRMAQHLGIRFRHHDALEDARTCGRIMAAASELTGIATPDWEETLKSVPQRPRYGYARPRSAPSAA